MSDRERHEPASTVPLKGHAPKAAANTVWT
jgi:hypothetical protein